MPVVLRNQPESGNRKAPAGQPARSRREVSPPVLIAVGVVLVLILGLIGWQLFGSHNGQMDAATIAAHQASKKAKEDR